MRRHPQTTTRPARPSNGASRWLTLAVALCGALAGGSAVEAIAAMAVRASIPVSPDHLIAAPLVIAGALCGGLLAAILSSHDRRIASSGSSIGVSPLASLASMEVVPTEPMMWQPAPQIRPAAHPASSNALTLNRPSRRAQRIHRAIRQRRHSYHAARIALTRPPTID